MIPKKNKDDGTLHSVPCKPGARGTASQSRLKGENNRDANDEDECREDQVGWRQTVPFCVIHKTP